MINLKMKIIFKSSFDRTFFKKNIRHYMEKSPTRKILKGGEIFFSSEKIFAGMNFAHLIGSSANYYHPKKSN